MNYTINKNIIVRICVVSTLIYASLSALAVVSQRHLFMDASWYLVKILSTGSFTIFWTDFWKEFYYTRAFATWLTEVPLIATISLFPVSATTASVIYGAGLYGVKLLATVLTFILLRKESRYLMVFPLVALWVGTASADLVIVSEAHVAATLAWPVLFSTTGAFKQTNTAKAFVLFCSIVLLLAYESMAFFGVIILGAAVLRDLRSRDKLDRRYKRVISLLAGSSLVISWCAIFWPRDASNRTGILSGLRDAFLDSSSLASSHPGPTLAFLAAATFISLLLWHRCHARWLAFLSVIMGSATALIPLARIYDPLFVFRSDLAYIDRALSLVLIPSTIMVLYVVFHFVPTKARGTAMALALALPCAVIGQSVNQLYETMIWYQSYDAVKTVVSGAEGTSLCTEALPPKLRLTSADPRKMVCGWSVQALSILVSPSPVYDSLLVGDSSFRPFDPFSATEYPHLNHVSPRVVPRISAFEDSRALIVGKQVSFNTSGEGWRYIVSGASFAEPYGTWSDAEKLVLKVCGPHTGPVPTQLKIVVNPFLGKLVPMQRVIIDWQGSEIAESVLTKWSAGAPNVLRIESLNLRSGSCGSLIIGLPDARSPKSVGSGDDPRRLGIMLLSMEAT